MKIGVVGSGMVGSTVAYAMVMRGIGREIVLVDKNRSRSQAEANDIEHAVPFSNPVHVKDGDYSALKGSRFVVISAGVSQKPGESRLDLLKRNAAVFKEVVPNIFNNAREAILIVVTNPVDIMTHLAAHYASEFDVPSARIIGSGTMLDTARFRALLGRHVQIDPQHVHAYVVGEHGDSEVLTWSRATIGGTPVEHFCSLHRVCIDDTVRDRIDDNVRNAAYRIIEGKGATYYGIGAAVAKIADVILHDQRSIMTVSTPTPDVAGVSDVCVSLPRLVGGEGVLATFPLLLDADENDALRNSAQVVRKVIDELGEI